MFVEVAASKTHPPILSTTDPLISYYFVTLNPNFTLWLCDGSVIEKNVYSAQVEEEELVHFLIIYRLNHKRD